MLPHFSQSQGKKTTFPRKTMQQSSNSVSDEELKRVIADFLDQGHVENIVAMFRREPHYYSWTGDILRDQRFSVRLGISVLFEELQRIQPEKLPLAIPCLATVLKDDEPLLRGEAVSLLGIIGSDPALNLIKKMADDPDSRVREMVQLVLGDCP